jgi:hypothetical protein
MPLPSRRAFFRAFAGAPVLGAVPSPEKTVIYQRVDPLCRCGRCMECEPPNLETGAVYAFCQACQTGRVILLPRL